MVVSVRNSLHLLYHFYHKKSINLHIVQLLRFILFNYFYRTLIDLQLKMNVHIQMSDWKIKSANNIVIHKKKYFLTRK
jgi:hypothetical protein